MTPWQARLAVLAFLLIASAILGNLLLLQDGRLDGASARTKTDTAAHTLAPRPPAAVADKREAKPAASRQPMLTTASTKAARNPPAPAPKADARR